MKDQKETLKMAIIAGASSAMEYKQKKPMATENEVIKHVTRNIREILEKVNTEY